jgi:tetratricopeptide (TPR) repeat protein
MADAAGFADMQMEEGTAAGAAAYHLAAYLFYSHSFEHARSLLEKATDPSHAEGTDVLRAKVLLGFVLLEQQAQEEPELQDTSEIQRALQLFDEVLQHEPHDLEVGAACIGHGHGMRLYAMHHEASNMCLDAGKAEDCMLLLQAVLGKARALEASQEQRAAWELLSEASIRLPWAVPVHMELARLTLAQQDWDSLQEVTARLQQVDSSNIMALAYTGEPHGSDTFS